MTTPRNEPAAGGRKRRILVVDDNPSICEDFKKILCPTSIRSNLASLEASIFGSPATASPASRGIEFEVDVVAQGNLGLEAVRKMVRLHTPYSLAFVDMRMPPGWDGVETCAQLWGADPGLQIVICSAYSDYSWHEVVRRLNRPELRLLQKPFGSKDVLDLAYSLTSRRAARPSQQPGT